MRTTLGVRSFHASAPALWNSLPAHIRTIDSLALFNKSLKTYLFKLAFRFELQSYRYFVFYLFTYLFINYLFIDYYYFILVFLLKLSIVNSIFIVIIHCKYQFSCIVKHL